MYRTVACRSEWHRRTDAASHHEESYMRTWRIHTIVSLFCLDRWISFAYKSRIFAENLNFHVDTMQQPVDSHGAHQKQCWQFMHFQCLRKDRTEVTQREHSSPLQQSDGELRWTDDDDDVANRMIYNLYVFINDLDIRAMARATPYEWLTNSEKYRMYFALPAGCYTKFKIHFVVCWTCRRLVSVWGMGVCVLF